MSNHEKPAFPLFVPQHEDYYGNTQEPKVLEGLTKREIFAKSIMQGVVSNSKSFAFVIEPKKLIEMVLELTDLLIAALEK